MRPYIVCANSKKEQFHTCTPSFYVFPLFSWFFNNMFGVLGSDHLFNFNLMYVVWQCLSGTSGPTTSAVYEHKSLVGFLGGTFFKVVWKIFLVRCWSFWYHSWKSPTLVLVDDIFCHLHTLNFEKVFFCQCVCIIPTKECFLKLSEVPVSYVYIHFSKDPSRSVVDTIWSPNKRC